MDSLFRCFTLAFHLLYFPSFCLYRKSSPPPCLVMKRYSAADRPGTRTAACSVVLWTEREYLKQKKERKKISIIFVCVDKVVLCWAEWFLSVPAVKWQYLCGVMHKICSIFSVYYSRLEWQWHDLDSTSWWMVRYDVWTPTCQVWYIVWHINGPHHK